MTKKASLDDLRRRIDRIDDQFLHLLNERAHLAQDIGRVKAERGETVFSADRETAIVQRLSEKNKGPIPDESLVDIFQVVFATCRSLQKRHRVAFFGPEATFTHQAAIHHFGRAVELEPVPSIPDVFLEVERKRVDFGVVPIENSTEGVVNHTLDMFVDSPLQIVAEREEPISHNLLSSTGQMKGIKTVYSHPQALAQCRKWLDIHLPGVALKEASSTADAAMKAALDGSSAAISSLLAASLYHLKPVTLKIEDYPNNTTRFLVIGNDAPSATGKDKTSVVFSVKDRVGALYDILKPFREAKLNLTKIESRPTRRRVWEYLFFVDFIGHQTRPHAKRALQQLKRQCTFFKILGSYPYGV